VSETYVIGETIINRFEIMLS